MPDQRSRVSCPTCGRDRVPLDAACPRCGSPRLTRRTRWLLAILPTAAICVLVLVLALLCVGLASGSEAGPEPAGVPLARGVLALYDSAEPATPQADQGNVHRYLEMPLNRLGLVVDHADVQSRPLPDPTAYRAIVLWFTDNRMARPAEYLRWLDTALANGVRVVAIDGLGADQDDQGRPVPDRLARQPLERFGLRVDDAVAGTENPFVLRREVVTEEHFQYETRLPPAAFYYERLVPIRDDVKPWLNLHRTDTTDSASALIAVSAAGGWIQDARLAVRYFEKPVYRVAWDLNPFAFLQAALGTAGEPRFDVTTACGRRAAFAHIDGDGAVNLTVDLPGPPRHAALAVRQEILEVYPVPITIGLVVGRVDPDALGQAAWLAQWRDLMALPHIQAGCHGYAHPMSWTGATVGLAWPGYTYSTELETLGAIAYLDQHILPPEKPVELFLWTGDCAPDEATLRRLRQAGMLEMNGGNPRLDDLYDSLSHISALTRPVGAERQIYAPAGNEYLYTNNWTENYGGFAAVIETFKRTTAPRLLPVNIYYHFYLAERQAGLRSLHRIYKWALKQPLCWIHAAEYVRAVHGFLQARIETLGEKHWRLSNYGACRTVRLDAAAAGVDLAASRNVLGYAYHAGSLYVTLGPAPTAELALAPPGHPAPQPYLIGSPGQLRAVTTTATGWRAELRAYSTGALTLGGFVPGRSLRWQIGEEAGDAAAGADGTVTVKTPAAWGRWREIAIGF